MVVLWEIPFWNPLFLIVKAKDLIIVQVNPIHKKGVPKTTRDIFDRLNQIIFNSSIIREIRGILNIQKLSQDVGIIMLIRKLKNSCH